MQLSDLLSKIRGIGDKTPKPDGSNPSNSSAAAGSK